MACPSWIMDNLQTLATLGSAAVVYVALRRGSKKDTLGVKEDVSEIRKDMKEIRKELNELNTRVARIEGNLFGPQLFRKQ